MMRESNDGFFIAERDLEIRGPGELLGARQSGALQFRIADLMRDQGMLQDVRKTAQKLLDHSPDQADTLVRRWIKDPERVGQV